jgi:ankyrin repeat protein
VEIFFVRLTGYLWNGVLSNLVNHRQSVCCSQTIAYDCFDNCSSIFCFFIQTPLWLAASRGYAHIVRLLVERQANVNAQVYEMSDHDAAHVAMGAKSPGFCGAVHFLASSGAGPASLSTLVELLKAPSVDLAAVDSAGVKALFIPCGQPRNC